VKEGDYTYAYIQFYWKRAQSYTDRILRVYPNTPTGKALASGADKIGPFDLKYFRERVLYYLQGKQQAAYDGIYCSIFLYNLDEHRDDDIHSAALAGILENLARQQRFAEALRLSVLPRDERLKIETVFTVAAQYEVDDVVKQMLHSVKADERQRLLAIDGKAIALRGRPRSLLLPLLSADRSDALKLAILDGMVERETAIRRAQALNLPVNLVELESGGVRHEEVRDDVVKVSQTYFPNGSAAADELLAKYQAGLGNAPALDAPIDVQDAYLDYLALAERYDDLMAYLDQTGLPGEKRNACMLRVVRRLAEGGRLTDAHRYAESYGTLGQAALDQANLELFRGQMDSSVDQLIVHSDTFSSLPIKDPCVLAQAIMAWSLTKNRALRGSSPWDSVVYEFAPGFENIPQAKAKAISDAAASTAAF
jgi:hypothetical protein